MTRTEKFEALEYMEKYYRRLYNESVGIDRDLAFEAQENLHYVGKLIGFVMYGAHNIGDIWLEDKLMEKYGEEMEYSLDILRGREKGVAV
nr:MAG TPA: hypothetical protein [Caudoviricetes sp.]